VAVSGEQEGEDEEEKKQIYYSKREREEERRRRLHSHIFHDPNAYSPRGIFHPYF